MNGPEHFREAERLVGKQLRTKIPSGDAFEAPPTTDEILQALTHAVLGLTAASAANIRRNGAMPGLADEETWQAAHDKTKRGVRNG